MTRLIVFALSLFFFVSCGTQEKPTNSKAAVLRIASEADPQTLDPRFARLLSDTTFMHMLYEGLVRVNEQGKYEQALAESITISDDGLVYEVRIKPTVWSDGTPLMAADFVETWKSMLDPAFPAPKASVLFLIKGAKEAKEGKTPLSNVRIRTLSDAVFTFELKEATAYIDELLGVPPVHYLVRNSPPSADPKAYIYNGPFTLSEWAHHDRLSFTKNPLYWDLENVKLDQVLVIVSDAAPALHLYEQGALDWVGSPLSTLPQDAIPSLKNQGVLKIMEASGTYWFRVNTTTTPFTDKKVRTAFALALNRNDIVSHVTQGNQRPAFSLLPPSMSFHPQGFYEDNQPDQAKLLLDSTLSNFTHQGSVLLSYSNNERHHKIAQAVQQQWEQALGVSVRLQAYEPKVAFDKLSKGDYQLMLGSWFADIDDPIDFLNVFKTKNNGTNNTGWEDAVYARLLDQASIESDPSTRYRLLGKAEERIMEDMPVIPLFHNAYNYLNKDFVKGVFFSELGFLDFKHAWIEGADDAG